MNVFFFFFFLEKRQDDLRQEMHGVAMAVEMGGGGAEGRAGGGRVEVGKRVEACAADDGYVCVFPVPACTAEVLQKSSVLQRFDGRVAHLEKV